MNKLKLVGMLALIALTFSACDETVPAGHQGKIMGKTGFQPELYPPSKVWVDTLSTVPEKLFLVQTTTKKYTQPVKVLLKDKLTLSAVIVFRGRISGSESVINTIFNDLPMNDNIVTTDEVYNTYGKMLVMNTAREVISKYNVDEVNTNYGRITVELYQALVPKLKGLPIEISDITIGEIRYPKIVTDAIESAKERRMAIEKEKAQVQIELTKKTGQEQLAKADYRIRMLEAKRIRDYNAMTAKGITPQLLQLRKLELRQLELEKWDGKLPTTLLGSSNVPVIVDIKK